MNRIGRRLVRELANGVGYPAPDGRTVVIVLGSELVRGSPGGIASATHGEAELDDTLKALRSTVRLLKQEGEI